MCRDGAMSLRPSSCTSSCVALFAGYFALDRGRTNGTAGTKWDTQCIPCPFGAVCNDGMVRASPGYWGGVMPYRKDLPNGGVGTDVVVGHELTLRTCPDGYCCDGGSAACDGVQACANGRVGRLCGECAPGHSHALGAPSCRRDSECNDAAWAVPVLVIAVTVAAIMMLATSDVVFPRTTRPSGLVKMVSYFFQVMVAPCACA